MKFAKSKSSFFFCCYSSSFSDFLLEDSERRTRSSWWLADCFSALSSASQTSPLIPILSFWSFFRLCSTPRLGRLPGAILSTTLSLFFYWRLAWSDSRLQRLPWLRRAFSKALIGDSAWCSVPLWLRQTPLPLLRSPAVSGYRAVSWISSKERVLSTTPAVCSPFSSP